MDINYVAATRAKPFGAKQAVGIFLAFILAMIFAGFLVSLVLNQFSPPETATVDQATLDTSVGGAIVMEQFVSLLAAGGIMIYLLRFYFPGSIKDGSLEKIGMVKCKVSYAISAGCVGFFLSLFFARGLGPLFPPKEDFVPNSLMTATQTGNWVQYLTAFMVVCIAPAVEELLFRGILYRGFSESWGKLPSGFFITILFILVHNETLSGGYGLAIAALMLISGFLLVARELSGSLLPPVIMHLGFNLALVLPT